MMLHTIIARGFDLSTRGGAHVRVRCSQCSAVVVNGHPIHERGCPNDTHECRGCNALIPARQHWCEDCA